jgi:alkylhydroperoxidase family enzyme
LQGDSDEVADFLRRGDWRNAPVTDAERALLAFTALLTENAYKNSPEEVRKLRDAGWNDDQIAECVYIAALFAFFNRVADGFGLEFPGGDAFQPSSSPQTA